MTTALPGQTPRQGRELFAERPQPRGSLGVPGQGAWLGWLAPDEVAPGYLGDLRRAGQVYRRLRAPCWTGHKTHGEPHRRAGNAGDVPAQGGAHKAGMQAVGGDAGAGQALGQLDGEQDVQQLREGIGLPLPGRCAAGQVIPRNRLDLLVSGGRDRDDPCGSAALQQPAQHVREQERPQVVGREGRLQPIGGQLVVHRDHASVVDEDVEPVVPGQDLLGQLAYLRQARQVGGHGLDLCERYLLADLFAGRRAARRVAGSDDHRSAERG